ncbi:MAG: leucine-rich repeat domain-containing protein, partial [Blautia obeum]
GEIPDEYIYIGDKCFLNNGKVHGVTLPAGCRVVGKQAFEGCQFQKSVEFPESLVEIKRRGFAGNRRLRKVVFPHNLERIGAQCYRECSNLKVAEFEKNSKCKVISEGIFDSCTKLERVCLPEAVKSIEKRAFYRCKELKEINLPNSVTGWEEAFICGIEELEPDKSENHLWYAFSDAKISERLYTFKCADDWPLGISWMQQTGAHRDFS